MLADSNKAAARSQPTLSEAAYQNWFILTSKGSNIYTADTMQELYELQQALGPSSFPYNESQAEDPPAFQGQTISDFPDHCHKPEFLNGRCASFFSPLEVVVFQGEPFTPADVAALTDDVVQARLREAYENDFPGGSDFFVSSDFYDGVEQDPPVYGSKYTQLFFFFGGPLPGYTTTLDREDEQLKEVEEWSTQYIQFLDSVSPRTFVENYYSDGFSEVEIDRLIQTDFILVGVAAVSVAFVVAAQTGSWIIAITGVLGVAWSYPAALVIYHGILGIQLNTVLNLLALFIVLGIGADDIFVLLDAWKQSEHEPESEVGPKGPEGLAQRVDWVWTRATSAMLATSLTTAVAFGVTSASPIPAIAAFGTIASLMVMVVFCQTTTTFVAVVVWWHQYGMELRCCCRSKESSEYCGDNCCYLSCWNTHTQQLRVDREVVKAADGAVGQPQIESEPARQRLALSAEHKKQQHKNRDVWAPASVLAATSGVVRVPAPGKVSPRGAVAPPTGEVELGQNSKSDDTPTVEHRAVDISAFRSIEQFFYKYWAPFVYNFRFVLLALFGVLLVASAVGAAYLEGPDKQAVSLPEESQIYQVIEILQPKFRPSSSSGFVQHVDGVWGVDPSNPIDRTGVDPNNEVKPGRPRYDPDFNPTTMEAQEFLAGVCDELVGLRFDPSDDTSPFLLQDGTGQFCPMQQFVQWQTTQFGEVIPFSSKVEMAAMMWNFSQTYQDPNFNASDPVSAATVSQFPLKDNVGEFFGGVTGLEGAEVLFIRSQFNLSISLNPGRVEQQQHYDAWNEHFEGVNSRAGEGYNQGVLASDLFAFLQTSNAMVAATWQAVGASVAVAAVCLLVSSGNWRIGAIATTMVAGIVLGILALMVAMGRKLDVVESISASVLVGLSVDYSTHIAISYSTSRVKGTFYRTRYALLELGVSIVGGASTSLISSFFLFFGALPFFQIFGSTLFYSLLIAFVYTMLFLPPMLIVLGPEQYPDGDIMVAIGRMIGSESSSSSGSRAVSKVDSPEARAGPGSGRQPVRIAGTTALV